MAYSKRSRAEKTKKLLVLIAACMTICIIFFAVYLVVLNRQPVNAGKSITQITVNNMDKKLNIVRAKKCVNPGELADITKFEIVAVPEGLVPKDAVCSIGELNDKRIKNTVTEKEFLMKSDLIAAAAWYEPGDRLIEHTFQPGSIPASITLGSIVDIKLFRENAEDPVVVAKAIVVAKQEHTISFYLNSMEQEYLKEANTEGLLFMTQYLDAIQPASSITYKPDYIKRTVGSIKAAEGSTENTESFAKAPVLH